MAKTCLLHVLVICLLIPRPSGAQLAQTAENSTRQLGSLQFQKSESHSAQGFRYVVLSSEDLVVKQYLNPANSIVFGITWKGKRAPDLLTLLGLDPYKITGPGVSRSLHATRIRTQNLSINIVVLMGHYSGSAVRTDLLPQGVSASVVTP
jgi:Protein of unknown function (DUF2844)